MAVERGAVELCQHIDAADAGVQTVADGDVHQTVFSTDRHSGLGPVLGEREKTGSGTSAHDDGKSARSWGDDLFVGHGL